VLNTVLEMIEEGATHLGVRRIMSSNPSATSFGATTRRVKAWSLPCSRSSDRSKRALAAAGVTVWPMIELEADDAMASAAALADKDPRVQKVCIWTPDKDLAQCVRGDRIVQVDRKGKVIRNADGVQAKFGVVPALIPDYLALVACDSADGYPGIPGIGPKVRRALSRGTVGSEDFRPTCWARAAISRCYSRHWQHSNRCTALCERR